MKRNWFRFGAAVALVLATVSTGAQTAVPTVSLQSVIAVPAGVQLPIGVELSPELVVIAGATNAAAQGSSTNVVPETPESIRLQELLKLKFDRSSTAILGALSAQFTEPAATNEVERFKQQVMVGDWTAVGKYLSALPADHGRQVYRYLLRELQNTRPPGQPGQPMPGGLSDQPVIVNPGQPGPGTSLAPALVLDDVLALAQCAPHEIDETDARALGQLLGRLLARGDALEPFVAKLDLGVKRLGGSQPEDRRRAAELLLGANRLTEAARFFPAIAEARAQLDWRALEQHSRDLVARGARERDSKLLMQAWELDQFVLGHPNVAVTNRDAALRRCMDLLPQLSRATGTNWLRERFRGEPASGLAVLSVVNQLVQRGLTDRALETRRRNLELQKQVMEMLLASQDITQPYWRTPVNLLAGGWLAEAAWAKSRYRAPRNYGAQYDQYGNMIGYENPPPEYYDGSQIPALAPEQVLVAAPDEAWLGRLDASLRLAVLAMLADLHGKTDSPGKALPLIEAVAAVQPRSATDLANAFLRAWAAARNPNRNSASQVRYSSGGVVSYTSSSGNMVAASGIPLTRATQARNLKELGGVLRRLEALNLDKLDDNALVGAFAAAHSPAEVFRVEDMEAVFGPRAGLKSDTLAGLAQTMRERLAQQWRTPRTQQEAKTQRTDKQIEAEVLRGYEVVLALLDEALQRDARSWRLAVARAATWFDVAEFQYGKKVDLAIYVEKREEAFTGFERAARIYAESLPGLEEKAETPQAYVAWFNATLGASDLAYVTRQQEPETNQIARIRSALLALPGGAAERHLAAFARQLGNSGNSLRPELKPRYLRAGLGIVGDHREAEDARKLVAYYDDLLNELELVVRLDGDPVVGHGRPFGVFVSLRHTADLERESGGFGRYLRNPKAANPYYSSSTATPQRNFPEEFEKQVREKLADHFEVKTVTFLDEKVNSRGYGRAGWRETPLGYLLLVAKDGSVDQLPAFHMDLDFMDGRGQVVLPVRSTVTLLDARPDRVPNRPLEKLEITQILDDREIAQGRVALEIKATARGLVPDLPQLLRTNLAHLELVEAGDRGLAINQLDTEAEELAPVSERNWLLKFNVARQAPASLRFQFPEAVAAGATMAYKRYADADLETVAPTLALAGVPLRPRPWWHWAVGGLVLCGLATLGIWWLRRKVVEHKPVAPAYVLPEPASPFAVLQLLRRMDADGVFRANDSQRTELTTEILRLEAHYFGRRQNCNGEVDLAGLGRRWLERAG